MPQQHNTWLTPSNHKIACNKAALLFNLDGVAGDAYTAPRRSERKPVRKAIVLMVESDDHEIRHDATTVDVSEHGARIEAEAALAPGQTLSLIQEDDPTHPLRCMVVWAGDVSSDGHDQAGLEFLDPLSATLEN